MRKFSKCVCLILVFALCMAIPVAAEETAPYASSYFTSHNTYLWNKTSTSFEVWFSITAVATMDELGVDYIDIEKSTDGVNWSVVKTYTKEDYPNLIGYNTAYHSGHVTYSNVQAGCQYRAYVKFYAKNSSGGRGYNGAYAYF